ncbi:ATPase inhibitor subunit zeta [Rhizobium sp. AC44/96]|uniref:ATPase inhibitor subunit zeta n=1 Tax=Rhizobium sp. AC44/96 TaxID=1841654 RepID=UPI000AA09BD1|nr:ATPase inhibitor subunit zeta [Rhizobium sp. AC44/96]
MAGMRTDAMRMVRRNKLVGMWAADKMGFSREEAKAYSDGLARDALDVDRNDILATIRRDFHEAGIPVCDEEVQEVMTASWLQAGKPTKGADASDVAVVQIARTLMK